VTPRNRAGDQERQRREIPGDADDLADEREDTGPDGHAEAVEDQQRQAKDAFQSCRFAHRSCVCRITR
jgi:hypothetical protein